MPKLHQVLQQELGGESALQTLPKAVLDDDVIGVFLCTGSPCESHAGAFEDWPGSETDVSRWFRLASGAAAGIRSRDSEPYGVALWKDNRHE